MFGGIAGAIIITTAFKNIKGKISKQDMLCNIKIVVDTKKIYLRGMIDTGNFLKDPISKKPVIVVEKEALYGKIDKKLLDNLEGFISKDNIDIDENITRIRLIPFNSLGRENGILTGIKVDYVVINYDFQDIYTGDVIMGIYDGKLSKTNKYTALIGLELLEYKGGSKNEYLETSKG